MPYKIQCRSCNSDTWALNIVDLIDHHTDRIGRLLCSNCGGTDTFICRKSVLQEKGEFWERWVKGVIRIDTGAETYSPYIFLTADEEDGELNSLHFNYYKDTRPSGGRLKHGHGPGGAPVLGINHLFYIIERLISFGSVSIKDIRALFR